MCDEELRLSPCKICGRPPTGYHYGVLTCSGCKTFFRRETFRGISALTGACLEGTGKCSTRANEGFRCRACRFRRCLKMGMRKQCLFRKYKPKAARATGQENSPRAYHRLNTEVNENDDSAEIMCLDYRALPTPTEAFLVCSSSDVTGTDMGSCLPTSALPVQLMQSSERSRFALFDGQSVRQLGANRQQMELTVYAVSAAIDAVFTDQIVSWLAFHQNHTTNCEIDSASIKDEKVTLENMMAAINWHNADHVTRVQQFAALLPGMNELPVVNRTCLTVGWKWLVYAVIHHAIFMSDTEFYIPVGHQEIRYRRYWQDQISQLPFTRFMFQCCSVLRKVGLTHIERYLLMAVVIFEPDMLKVSDEACRLRIIHRHYSDVLFDHIKRRCADAVELQSICQKLENFSDMFKMADIVRRHYYGNTRHRSPQDTVAAEERIRMVQKGIKSL